MTAKPRVLVLGGGFAGLETAFMLRMRVHDAVDITLVSDNDQFNFKPNSIYIPFGAEPESLLIDLDAPLRKRNIDLFQGSVRQVDTEAKHVALEDGTNLPYDYLIIGTGATMRPSEIPGLADHASTIWTSDEMLKLRADLAEIKDRASREEHSRVLFLVPPNNKCSGPLYEMVFMLETWSRREKIRDFIDITYSTYERTFIQAFGPRLDEVVHTEFAKREIEGANEEVVTEVRDGLVHYESTGDREFDFLISFPPYVAAVHYEGLPSDDRGFLTTELETRQVVGQPDVYAPGDGGDFPVKQAFLAFLQGDAVADHLDSEIRGHAFTKGFDPISMCVMEMFDKATFAQVPLELTGDPKRPVQVRAGADDDYKVGVSPVWRIGKKTIGIYLNMRFGQGEPFHAGAGWQAMDIGLKGMVGVLAD